MKIVYLSVKDDVPDSGYWDQTFIEDLVGDIKTKDRTLIVIPGAYQGDVDAIEKINEKLSAYKKILVIITSDEESKFNIAKLSHPDMIVYTQYRMSKNMLPLGYTPLTRQVMKDIGVLPKTKNWFFSGQVTSDRRKEMVKVLKGYEGGTLIETTGFAQGLKAWDYYHGMAESNAVICPPGAVSKDSFRLYEALEAGSVPILDRKAATKEDSIYWEPLFPDAPFPFYDDVSQIPDLVEKAKDQHYQNKVTAWWVRKKYELKQELTQAVGGVQENMTVLISVSPIPSHPSTKIINETIKSIRVHTNAPIFVTIDGVRPEQESMRTSYEQFIRNFLHLCLTEYKNVVPYLFDEHVHQSGMLKSVLEEIKTPLMMYVEHDTPLVTDKDLDLKYLKAKLLTDRVHVVRFHFEDFIPEPHKYLMIGEPEDRLLKTAQWSQRPHIAKTDFYRNVVKFFSKDAKCFIEDLLYGKLVQAWDDNGIEGWKAWRVWIYHPDGGIKRSLNLDGRAGGKKYDEDQVW